MAEKQKLPEKTAQELKDWNVTYWVGQHPANNPSRIGSYMNMLAESDSGKVLAYDSYRNDVAVFVTNMVGKSYGIFMDDKNKLMVNKNADHSGAIRTMAHELRHAQQFNNHRDSTNFAREEISPTARIKAALVQEADAEAYCAKVCFELKEKGIDGPYQQMVSMYRKDGNGGPAKAFADAVKKDPKAANNGEALKQAFVTCIKSGFTNHYEQLYLKESTENTGGRSMGDKKLWSKNLTGEDLGKMCVVGGANYLKGGTSEAVDLDKLVQLKPETTLEIGDAVRRRKNVSRRETPHESEALKASVENRPVKWLEKTWDKVRGQSAVEKAFKLKNKMNASHLNTTKVVAANIVKNKLATQR